MATCFSPFSGLKFCSSTQLQWCDLLFHHHRHHHNHHHPMMVLSVNNRIVAETNDPSRGALQNGRTDLPPSSGCRSFAIFALSSSLCFLKEASFFLYFLLRILSLRMSVSFRTTLSLSLSGFFATFHPSLFVCPLVICCFAVTAQSGQNLAADGNGKVLIWPPHQPLWRHECQGVIVCLFLLHFLSVIHNNPSVAGGPVAGRRNGKAGVRMKWASCRSADVRNCRPDSIGFVINQKSM